MADPYVDAIVAQLPPADALSPEAQRVAAGVALIRQGKTYREAAKAVGLSHQTIWRHAHGLCSSTRRNEAMAEIESQIEDLSAQLTVRAAETILDRLETDDIKSSEIIKAMQVARDTLAMRRQWQGNTTAEHNAVTALTSALEAMRGRVTIQAADPVTEAQLVSDAERGE